MQQMRLKDKLLHRPNLLIRLDAFGAIYTASMLIFVLANLQGFFGIPPMTLYFLAVFPLIFLVVDSFALTQSKDIQLNLLSIIALLNFSYCVIAALALLLHWEVITVYGYAYIIIEILVLIWLASFELRVARQLR